MTGLFRRALSRNEAMEGGARCPQRADLRGRNSKPDEDIGFPRSLDSFAERAPTPTLKKQPRCRPLREKRDSVMDRKTALLSRAGRRELTFLSVRSKTRFAVPGCRDTAKRTRFFVRSPAFRRNECAPGTVRPVGGNCQRRLRSHFPERRRTILRDAPDSCCLALPYA